MDKKVLVIVSEAPSLRVAEKLRMSVGLTLEDGLAVTLLLVDDGVFSLHQIDPTLCSFETVKHIQTVQMMGHTVVASKDAALQRGVGDPVKGVTWLTADEIAAKISEAQVTL